MSKHTPIDPFDVHGFENLSGYKAPEHEDARPVPTHGEGFEHLSVDKPDDDVAHTPTR